MIADQPNESMDDNGKAQWTADIESRHADPSGGNLVGNRAPGRQAGDLDLSSTGRQQPGGQLAHNGGRAADLQVGDEQEDSPHSVAPDSGSGKKSGMMDRYASELDEVLCSAEFRFTMAAMGQILDMHSPPEPQRQTSKGGRVVVMNSASALVAIAAIVGVTSISLFLVCVLANKDAWPAAIGSLALAGMGTSLGFFLTRDR